MISLIFPSFQFCIFSLFLSLFSTLRTEKHNRKVPIVKNADVSLVNIDFWTSVDSGQGVAYLRPGKKGPQHKFVSRSTAASADSVVLAHAAETMKMISSERRCTEKAPQGMPSPKTREATSLPSLPRRSPLRDVGAEFRPEIAAMWMRKPNRAKKSPTSKDSGLHFPLESLIIFCILLVAKKCEKTVSSLLHRFKR